MLGEGLNGQAEQSPFSEKVILHQDLSGGKNQVKNISWGRTCQIRQMQRKTSKGSSLSLHR